MNNLSTFVNSKRSIILILLFFCIKCNNNKNSKIKLDEIILKEELSFKFPDSLKVYGFYLAQIKPNNGDTEFIFHNRKKNIIITFNKKNLITYKKCPINIYENFLINAFKDTILSFSYYDNKFNIWNNNFIKFYKLQQLNDSFQYIPLNLNFSDSLIFFYRLIRYYNEEQFYSYYNKGFYPLLYMKLNGKKIEENTPIHIIPIKYFFKTNKNKNLPHQSINLSLNRNNLYIENSYSDYIFKFNLLNHKNNISIINGNSFNVSPRFFNYDTSKLDPTVLMFMAYNIMNKVYDLVYLENTNFLFRTIKLSDSLRIKIRRDMVFQLLDTNFRVIKNYILKDSTDNYTILPFEHIGKILFCKTNYIKNSYELYSPVFN